MDRLQHNREFDERYASLEKPQGYLEAFPPTYFPFPSIYSWKFRWIIVFPDNYIQIREFHQKVAKLQESQRVKFSYHYGPIVQLEKNGIPTWNPSDPVEIRIDNSDQPVHLHYRAQEPHYSQDKVRDLALSDLDMFTFVKAIFRHRKSGHPIHKTLHFRVG